MLIRFCKGDNTRDTLVCVRDDGTSAWSKLTDQFAYHDLVHYVVETTLGCRNAFYGMIAQGWNIEDFTEIDPATGARRPLPEEAHQVEALVLIVSSQLGNGTPNEELMALLELSCASQNLPTLRLMPEHLDTIREQILNYWRQWRQTPAGKALEVTF